MKRRLASILPFLLLLPLMMAACTTYTTDIAVPANFYYPLVETNFGREKSLFVPEQRDIAGMEADLTTILQLYFNGPENKEVYQNPFPKNMTLLNIWEQDDSLLLDLSQELHIPDIDTTIACACIALTCFDLTDVETVRFQVPGQQLNGQPVLTISRSGLQLYDNSLEALQQSVTLYYSDMEQRYLIGHDTTIPQSTLEDTCVTMITMLTTPPDGLISPLPVGTQVLDVKIRSGVCTINLSKGFEVNAFSDPIAQRTTLMSITNTLTQLDGIDAVMFAVEGNQLFHYGVISTSTQFSYCDTAVGPARPSVNEFDVTLYVTNESGVKLLPVPTAVRLTTGATQSEQALMALFAFQDHNGFVNPIPNGSEMVDLKMEDSNCTVTLGGSILTEGTDAAFHAIVATLCELEEVQRVYIVPTGDVAVTLVDYFYQPLSPASAWYES